MRSANLSAPLKGFRPYNALIGLNQASGLAGGPDLWLRNGNLALIFEIETTETKIRYFGSAFDKNPPVAEILPQGDFVCCVYRNISRILSKIASKNSINF